MWFLLSTSVVIPYTWHSTFPLFPSHSHISSPAHFYPSFPLPSTIPLFVDHFHSALIIRTVRPSFHAYPSVPLLIHQSPSSSINPVHYPSFPLFIHNYSSSITHSSSNILTLDLLYPIFNHDSHFSSNIPTLQPSFPAFHPSQSSSIISNLYCSFPLFRHVLSLSSHHFHSLSIIHFLDSPPHPCR